MTSFVCVIGARHALLDAQSPAVVHSWTTPEYAAWISPLWNPSRR
jgi:hypothetical protein